MRGAVVVQACLACVLGVYLAGSLTVAGAAGTGEAGAAPSDAGVVSHSPESPARAATDSGPDAVAAFIDALIEGIAGNRALAEFYAGRSTEKGVEPLWTGLSDADRRAVFFAALEAADAHGLPVDHYDAAGLRLALGAVRTERERALIEVRMSRAWIDYAQDITNGVLNPKRVDPGIVRAVPRRQSSALLRGFAEAASPAGYLRGLVPADPRYGQLLKARLDLETKIAEGGWGPQVVSGTLRPGDRGPQVVALRDRLQAMGYLGRSVAADYDRHLRAAVAQYQADAGLAADGVAGAATLAALNTPPEARMRAILVAMERLRWMNGLDLGARHIWVNIPDYTAQIVENDRVVFDTNTVVGQDDPDRRTPEFSDMMRMVVINPTWHVPRSITVREYLPMMKRNPNAASHINVVDKNGRVVPRSQINFAAYDERTFPFRMKQAPSDDNALGLVKFLFPNPWNIYLHDTPSKSLFSKDMRAFSHGCIRIAKPFDLAYELLAPQQPDPEAYFQKILATGKETTVRLDPPVPVHLVYFTAWPGAEGRIGYRADVYGRDAAVFAALQRAGVELAVPAN